MDDFRAIIVLSISRPSPEDSLSELISKATLKDLFRAATGYLEPYHFEKSLVIMQIIICNSELPTTKAAINKA